MPSSSSPPPSLLPYLSRKRSKSPSPSLPPSVSPSPLPSPPPPAVPPPPEHIELVGDAIETLRDSLASAIQETTTFRARVGLLEQHDVQDIKASRARAEAAEQRAETLEVSLGSAQMDVRDLIESHEADRFEMAELRSRETMSTTNQGMSFAKIEQIVAHRVANAFETIVIYEAKTHTAHDLMNRVKQQEDKVAENASNKRK
nr:hypothetical protein [Tanacetum cinerariifolium]